MSRHVGLVSSPGAGSSRVKHLFSQVQLMFMWLQEDKSLVVLLLKRTYQQPIMILPSCSAMERPVLGSCATTASENATVDTYHCRVRVESQVSCEVGGCRGRQGLQRYVHSKGSNTVELHLSHLKARLMYKKKRVQDYLILLHLIKNIFKNQFCQKL